MNTQKQNSPKAPETKARRQTYAIHELQATLKENFSLDLQNLERLSEEEHGENSQVFFAMLEGTKVIVKIADEARDFEIENAAVKLMQNEGIPVPQVIAWKPNITKINKPVMIQSVIPGKSLDRTPYNEITSTIANETGEILRRMHEVKIPGFGKLDVKNGSLKGRCQTFRESIEQDTLDHESLVTPGYISEEEYKLLESIRNEIAAIDLPKASLVHYDFHPEHVFSDGKHVTGFIDFSNAIASDPRTDIAKAHYEFPKKFQEPFDQGYGELAYDPIVVKLETLFAAQKVMYRHENGYMNRIPMGVKILKRGLEAQR